MVDFIDLESGSENQYTIRISSVYNNSNIWNWDEGCISYMASKDTKESWMEQSNYKGVVNPKDILSKRDASTTFYTIVKYPAIIKQFQLNLNPFWHFLILTFLSIVT